MLKIALALLLAQVTVNESGFNSRADCRLIYQITEYRGGPTTRGKLQWLRSHSGRVAGIRPCKRGNCLWTRHLGWSSIRPRQYPSHLRWRPNLWAQVRAWSLDLVDGRDLERPCRGNPFTWDGPRWRQRALDIGFVLLPSPRTQNLCWGLPGDQPRRGRRGS